MSLKFILSLIISLIVTASAFGQHNHSKPKKKPASPPDSAFINLVDSEIAVRYSSPRVRGRMIWGGLVGFDRVWVAGAHQATKITFSEEVEIAGTKVNAGSYAFFTIPGKEKWTIILNKNWDQHLADDYDSSLDVVRVEVSPKMLEESSEELRYFFEKVDESTALLNMVWDKLQISLEINVKD